MMPDLFLLLFGISAILTIVSLYARTKQAITELHNAEEVQAKLMDLLSRIYTNPQQFEEGYYDQEIKRALNGDL